MNKYFKWIISFLLTVGMVVSMSAGNIVKAISDNQPPELISLDCDHSGKIVKIGDTVTFTAVIHDDSGVDMTKNPPWISIESAEGQAKYCNLNEVSEDHFEAKLTIDEKFVNGDYKVTYISLHDNYNNQIMISESNDTKHLLKNTAFSVKDGLTDNQPPRLLSLTCDSNGKTVTVGDQVVFTATIHDDANSSLNTEKSNICLENTGGQRKHCYFKKVDGDQYEAKLDIDKQFVNGKFIIYYISIEDACGNSKVMGSYSEEKAMITDKYFIVSGGIDDNQPPKLISLTCNKNGKEVSAGDEVIFTAEIQDDSEIDLNDVKSYISLTNNSTQEKNCTFEKVKDNQYIAKLKIDDKFVNGEYKIGYVVVSDVHGNNNLISSYNNDMLEQLSFTVTDGDDIKAIDHAFVLKSSVSDKTYDGDVYIAPDCDVTLDHVTVNGTIYVLGSLQVRSITANALKGKSLTVGGSASGYGSITTSGSNNISSMSMSKYPVTDIPFMLKTDQLKSVDGKISYSGATLEIADMVVNGQKVKTTDGKFSVKNQDIGDADHLTFTWTTVFGNTISKTYKVKRVVTDQNGIQNTLPELNVSDQEVCIDSDLSLLTKAILATDEEDGDLTSKIQVDYHAIDLSKTGTYLVEYSVQDSQSGITKKVVNIQVNNHQWGSWKETLKPTCTKEGTKERTCLVCGKKETDTIPKLGHQYGEWISLDEQQHQRICKNDSSHVEKEDHHFDEGKITTEPTYVKEGIKTYTCKDCGFTKTKSIVVKPHTHDYKERITKQPTCTGMGVKTFTCSICNDSYTKDIPALGHNYGDWTQLDDRQHQRICKNDSSHVEKEDHKWDEGKIVTQTAKGSADEIGKKDYVFTYKVFICTVCHATKVELIQKEEAQDSKPQQPQPSVKQEKIPAIQQTNVQNEKSNQSTQTKTSDEKEENPRNNEIFSDTAVIDQKITMLKGDRDLNGSKFSLLQLKANKVTKSSIKLGWKKVKSTRGYVVYGNKCGKKYQKIATTKGFSWTQKKLAKGTYYKYLVAAYGKNGEIISVSKTIHVCTRGGKKGNPSGIILKSPRKIKLKIKKTTMVKAIYKLPKKVKISKHRALAFESTNNKIARVSSKGKIIAVKKGTCSIYIYGQNGVFTKVSVKVK